MRGNEFLDKMELIDPAYVEAADAEPKKKRAWMKWAAAAACLCLIAAAALPYFLPEKNCNVEPPIATGERPPVTEEVPSATGDEPDEAFSAKTSETYSTLSELLGYLSAHESHDDRLLYASDGYSVPAAPEKINEGIEPALVENTGVAVTADGGYSYHIGANAIYISQLDGKNTQNAGSIDKKADAIFACGDNLLVVSQSYSEGDGPDLEFSVCVSIYDITVPHEPALKEEYTQLGELASCWMLGAELYLTTSDGQCACGWSRLDDASQYYPSLQHNGEAVEWPDEDISILGEPTKVQYSAVTAIDGNSGQVVRKKAIYGNIQNLFYGEGWIAASVAGETLSYRENPALYTFDSDLRFTGKINTAEIMGAPEANGLEDGMPQAGSYLSIVSVSNYKGIYRLLGTFVKDDGDSREQSFMAIAANSKTGEANSQLLKTDAGYPYGEFTEILWEGNRAIICIGITDFTADEDLSQETRFLFAEYDGLGVKFHETEWKADYLNSQVGIMYGSPLGCFETLIPMGEGIYLRYSNPEKGPGGFDVFDFSDSAAPKLLYRAESSLSGQDAFDFVWHIYGTHTFGTLKVLLSNEEEYSRNVKLSWCIYSVDTGSETAVTLQEEHLLDEEIENFNGAESIGFTVFEAGGNVYYVTNKNESATAL